MSRSVGGTHCRPSGQALHVPKPALGPCSEPCSTEGTHPALLTCGSTDLMGEPSCPRLSLQNTRPILTPALWPGPLPCPSTCPHRSPQLSQQSGHRRPRPLAVHICPVELLPWGLVWGSHECPQLSAYLEPTWWTPVLLSGTSIHCAHGWWPPCSTGCGPWVPWQEWQDLRGTAGGQSLLQAGLIPPCSPRRAHRPGRARRSGRFHSAVPVVHVAKHTVFPVTHTGYGP